MNGTDYLWDPAGGASVDPFVAELERRLAPLGDDVGTLVDELEVEKASEAVILTLPVAPLKAVDRQPERSWPWLAAALAVLGLSLLPLAREQRRVEPGQVVDVGGANGVAGRVDLGVHSVSGETTAHAVLVSLRDAHDELANCALALAPGAKFERRVALKVDAGSVTVGLGALGDGQVGQCVRSALAHWDVSALGQVEVEIDLLLQDYSSEHQ